MIIVIISYSNNVLPDIALYTTVLEETSNVTCNLEQLWLIVKEPGRRFFVIGIVYRPPASSIKAFMQEMRSGLKTIYKNNKGK